MWDKQETAELVEAGAAKAEFIRDGDAKDSLLGTICFSTNASVHPFKASPYLKAKSIDRTCLRFDFHPHAVEGLFLQAFGHSELTCSESTTTTYQNQNKHIILSTPAKVPQVPVLRKPQAHWPGALVQGDVLKANLHNSLVFKSLANFRRVSIVMLKSPKSIKSKKTWITTTHSSLQLTFWCYLWSFGKAATFDLFHMMHPSGHLSCHG